MHPRPALPSVQSVDLIAAGMSNEEILKDYPYLEALESGLPPWGLTPVIKRNAAPREVSGTPTPIKCSQTNITGQTNKRERRPVDSSR
jgi:hypothetical protein